MTTATTLTLHRAIPCERPRAFRNWTAGLTRGCHHDRVGRPEVPIAALLWDPGRDAVLVGTAPNPVLPIVTATDDGFGGALPAEVSDRFGIRVVLLEPLGPDSYVCEVLADSAAVPVGHAWIEVDSLHRWFGDDPRVLRWRDRRASPQREWFGAGWYARALAYVDGELGRLGHRRTGPGRQVKHWVISSVIRIPSSAGAVYLKTTAAEVSAEAELQAFLARRWPDSLPQRLASSPERGMTLTADFGGEDGWSLAEPERIGALDALTRMQIELSDDVDALLDIGLQRSDPRDLLPRIPELLGRTDLWDAKPGPRDHWTPLTERQRSMWATLSPWLAECCARLAELSAVPLSLVHGDFHPGNTARRPSGFVLHDWGLAEVAHPYFDLARWLDDTSEPAAHAYVARFLGAWGDSSVWKVAKPVAALHEIDKVVRLVDEFGPAHAFSVKAVAYGWVRRLLGAFGDPDATVPNWPKCVR